MTAIKKDFIVKNGLQVSEDAIVTGNVTASSFIGDGTQLTGVSHFSGSYNDLINKPTLFSGSYNDLTDKPVIPTIPTNISAFTNDTGYLVTTDLTWTNISGKPTFATVATSGSYNDLTDKPTIPSLTGYATESYVNTQVANLVDSSPTALNTLNELAAALADDPNFSTTITNQLSLKANISSLATVATTGSYNDLLNKPDLTVLTSVDTIQLDTTYNGPTPTGQISWNSSDGTIDIGLNGGNVVLQVGQEQVQRIFNNTGSTLTEGTAVYIAGAQGQRLTVGRAQANAESTSSKTFGVVTENIGVELEGYITTEGLVRNINTSAYAEGAALWLSPTTPGGITTTKPAAPQHLVLVGFCVRQHATAGSIFVKVQNGYELDELHDVLITTPQANNDVLKYDAVNGVWRNSQLFDQSLNTNDNPSFSGISTNYLTLNGDSGFWGKIVTSQGSGGAIWDSLKTVGGTSLIGSGDISLFSGSYNDLTNKPAITPTAVSDQHNTSTGYFSLPRGTSAQRPIASDGGDIRFNTNASVIEYYNGSMWASIGLLDGSSVATAAPTATDLKNALIGFNGSATSGIYWLKPPTSPFAFQAYIDFDTANGPWVHVGNALGGSSPGELWAYPATWKSRTDNYGTYTDPTLSGNSFNAGAFIYCKGNSIMAKEGGGNSGRGGSVGYTQCSGFSNESWRDVYNAAIGSSWPGTSAYYYRLLPITTKTVPQSSLITGVSWDVVGAYTHFVVYAFDGGGDTMGMLQTASYDGSGATTQTEADCGFGANENGSGAGGSPTSPILTAGATFDVGSNGTQATGWSGVPFSLWIKN